jgi:hypothetical protein
MRFSITHPKAPKSPDVITTLAALITGSFLLSGILSHSPHLSDIGTIVETNSNISLALCTTLCNVLYQRSR